MAKLNAEPVRSQMLEVTSEMSSPHPTEGPEISSGSIVVSETDSAAKSHKPDMRRRKDTRQSPFKVPDSNSLFLQTVNKRGEQKEDLRKFLALPIDEKTTHTARMTAKLREELEEQVEEEAAQEEKKKMKNLKQMKSSTVLPEQTPGRQELKMAMMKRESVTKDRNHDLIYMARQKAVLELSLMTKRSEILRMDKAIAKEEETLRQLEETIERDNLNFEEFLRENEKKAVEARAFFEQEAKEKQEKNAEIRKLTAEIGTLKSETADLEEILIEYKIYKDLLFKLSPPEWQEAQRTKALKAKVLSDRDAQDKQNTEPQESTIRNDLESEVSHPSPELPSIRETRPSSAHSDSLIMTAKLDSDISEYEDEPELYFTDPQQLLDLMKELTEQNLSLMKNSGRVEDTLEEVRQSMEKTRKMIEKDEEQLTLQINEMNQRIDTEKARASKLKQKVQLHVSLNTEDQDIMLDTLGEKVAEVYRCYVDDRVTNLSTLEKLASIEKRMSLLLQSLESIPEESLKSMKKIKTSERRSRQREEKLREQREKQEEKMRRYLERSLADSKKITGRKLMMRSRPLDQKVRVNIVDNTLAEDELHAYLFTSEDTK